MDLRNQKIIDKLLLYTCSGILYYFSIGEKTFLAFLPMMIVFFLSLFTLLFQNPFFPVVIYFISVITCCFFPLFTIFLPVLFYDLGFTAFKWCIIFSILPFVMFFNQFSITAIVFTALFFSISVILYAKTSSMEVLQKDYETFRAASKELSFVQEEKNRSILENQDYEIQTATLNERNRISKEIHDRIGHLLSRSLLQIGALLTISKDTTVSEGLTELKVSISEGMDSIRDTIHNIHNESIDLEGTLGKLIREFTLCTIAFKYRITNTPGLKTKYCLIAVTKESLTNISKHSNGNLVEVRLLETPTDYCLFIGDNGVVPERTKILVQKGQGRAEYPDGLGLQSISDRVKGLNGRFLIHTDQGFVLNITIPKESGV